jgi:hypothetical protein
VEPELPLDDVEADEDEEDEAGVNPDQIPNVSHHKDEIYLR